MFIATVKESLPKEKIFKLVFTNEQKSQLIQGSLKLTTTKDSSFY